MLTAHFVQMSSDAAIDGAPHHPEHHAALQVLQAIRDATPSGALVGEWTGDDVSAWKRVTLANDGSVTEL